MIWIFAKSQIFGYITQRADNRLVWKNEWIQNEWTCILCERCWWWWSFIRSFVHSFVRLHSRSCSFNWPSSFVAPSTIIPTNPCGRSFGCCHRCSLRITDQVIYSWSTTISARLASHLINLLFFIVLSFSFLSFLFCSLLTIRFHWTRTQANTQANVNPFLSFSLTHTHTHATRNTTGYIVIIWSVHYVI